VATRRKFNYAKRERELRKQKKAKDKLEARRARRSGGEAKADAQDETGGVDPVE
jgi:hypothetical protein